MKDIAKRKRSFRFPPLDKSDIIALSICGIIFVALVGLLSYKYFHFGYYDWDFALYSQVMWNVTHGSLYTSLFGMNFLANHAHYFAFMLAPFYIFFQHPMTLIVFKISSYVIGAFVLYLLAKKSMGWVYAIVMMILYVLYPANINMLLYEFHFESLAIALLFLGYYFFKEERFIPFCITLFFLAIIKENMSLIAITFGIYSIFIKRNNKLRWILVPIFIGAFIFYITMFIITPLLRAQISHPNVNAYLGYYSHLGDGPSGIAHSFLFNPIKIFHIIAKPLNINYVYALSGPLLVLVLLSPQVIFLISPVLFQHLLSSAYQPHTIYYHYAATIIPFVFLAAINSLRVIRERMRPHVYQIILWVSIILCACNTLSYAKMYIYKISSWKDNLDPARRRMVENIPRNASVIATFDFLDALSQRESLYAFYTVWQGKNAFTRESPYPNPEDVDYALLDLDNGWIIDGLSKMSTSTIAKRIDDFFSKSNWNVIDAAESIVLLKKEDEKRNPLVTSSKKRFLLPKGQSPLLIDKNIHMNAFEIGNHIVDENYRIPFTFYWKCTKENPNSYDMVFFFKKDGKIISARKRMIGYVLHPTSVWEKGEYIKEKYWMVAPDLSPGNYEMMLGFINKNKNQLAHLLYAKNDMITDSRLFNLGVITINK